MKTVTLVLFKLDKNVLPCPTDWLGTALSVSGFGYIILIAILTTVVAIGNVNCYTGKVFLGLFLKAFI